MEISKPKTNRVCGFININGEMEKKAIDDYAKHPIDATSYILWYSKDNSEEWGLTIKSVPKAEKQTQHTWKMTWFCDKEKNQLTIANHCKSLGSDIVGDGYLAIKNIYTCQRKL